jgi:hypothetical protein
LGSWGFAGAQNLVARCLNRKVPQNPAMPWVLNPAESRAGPNPAAAAAAGIDGVATLGLLLLLLLGTLHCLLLQAQGKTSESAVLTPAAAAGRRCCSWAGCLAAAAAYQQEQQKE